MTEDRRFTAIVNPISGRHDARSHWDAVARHLGAARVAGVVTTDGPDHAIAAATEAASNGDIVVAVGGDGQVRDVATGVVRAGGTMALVPAGRGNDMARALHVPTDPMRLAELLLSGPVREIDVLRVGDAYVPGNVYAGIDGTSTLIINRFRCIPSTLLYRIAPLWAAAAWRAATFTLSTDAGSTPQRAHMVVIANSGHYGSGLTIVPSAVLDDGQLDMMVVGDVPIYKLATLANEAKTGSHVRRAEVSVSRSTQVTLSADRPMPVFADGDQLGVLPVTIEVVPRALRLIVPANENAAQ
jgi:diacylglycerol kinase (ATP)